VLAGKHDITRHKPKKLPVKQMKHCCVAFKPDGKRVFVHGGATILEAAGQAGIILNTVCGRRGICKKCTVELEPDRRKVLACQYKIESDIVVIIPQTSRFLGQQILEHGTRRQIKIRQAVCKKFIKNIPKDVKTLQAALHNNTSAKDCELTPVAAKQFEQLSTASQAVGLTAVYRRKDASDGCIIIALEQGDTTGKLYGLAIDIGTTTVVNKLIDLTNGEQKATTSAFNSQSIHGDDVVSRIAYANTKQNLAELHNLIIDCINKLTAQICSEAGIQPQDIYEAVVVANTTMNHILLRFPIKQLGMAPYKAYSVDAQDRPAGEMALVINPVANVHTVENISGFVGSDTTAVALAVGMTTAEKISLAVDIGTNGELVLGTAKRLYATSCAAGPALEGARIAQGSRAVDGAIQRLFVNGNDIDLDVIGAGPARTICGSGLIDTVAELLNLGIIDATGRFVPASRLEGKLPPAILARMIRDKTGPAFCLAWNRKNGGQTVILTQGDIREVQLAKGAIRAGIIILLRKMGIDESQIEQVFLAGAFGNYIRPESAVRLGLLPQIPLERIHFVGNAAASGAEMVLLDSDYRVLARDLARKIEYVEIAHEPNFQTIFADSMGF